jgi:hypothetical protein
LNLKLDENIGRRGVEILQGAGHDVMTVRDQRLEGAKDEKLYAVCAGERRVLITLDRDFGEVLRFPPEKTAGIVIPDVGPRATVAAIGNRRRDFLAVARDQSVNDKLWIVEPGRVRIHLRDE